jgi:molybdopterin biosynthesis enzyme
MLKASLTRKVVDAVGRKTYLRVHVSMKGGEFFAEPVSTKGPGSISTMTQSNGYVVISEDICCLSEGEMVVVHLFDSLEVSE